MILKVYIEREIEKFYLEKEGPSKIYHEFINISHLSLTALIKMSPNCKLIFNLIKAAEYKKLLEYRKISSKILSFLTKGYLSSNYLVTGLTGMFVFHQLNPTAAFFCFFW